jgi:hypothetical protein
VEKIERVNELDMEGWIEWYYENSQPRALRRETSTTRFVEREKKMETVVWKRKVSQHKMVPGACPPY